MRENYDIGSLLAFRHREWSSNATVKPLMKSLVAILCLSSFLASLAFAEFPDSDFDRLHQELRQSPDEAWRTVPWKISLLDAQAAASQQHKPIFIWAMDGHPLGCT